MLINKKGRTHKRKVLFVLKLSLVLILGHVVVRTTLMPQHGGEIFAQDSVGGGEQATAVDVPVAPDSPAPDYSAIVERDLFGSKAASLSAVESAPAEKVVISAPPVEDKLEIALLGTVAGSPLISRAIIKDLETNVLGHYKTGDTILSASIESIEKDRIVLLHRGQRRIVNLCTTKGPATGDTAGARATASQASAPKPVEVNPAPRPMNTFADKLRHAAMMLPKATVEPYTVKGEVEGLRLTDLDSIEGAKDLGLKDGDVIRSINGHRLDSKQKAFQVAMKARSQASLSVELMRNNRIKNFSMPLR